MRYCMASLGCFIFVCLQTGGMALGNFSFLLQKAAAQFNAVGLNFVCSLLLGPCKYWPPVEDCVYWFIG